MTDYQISDSTANAILGLIIGAAGVAAFTYGLSELVGGWPAIGMVGGLGLWKFGRYVYEGD